MSERLPALERRLAALLRRGTWAASSAIAAGLLIASFHVSVGGYDPGSALVSMGIALFVALPITRVSLMAASYLKQRDLRFAVISGIVLAMILIGGLIGLFLPGSVS